MPTRWQPSKLIRHTFQCERPQPRGGLRPLVFSWRHPVLARLPSMLPLVALLPASSMLPIMASEPAWAMDTTAVHKKTARKPDFSFSMRGKANIFCYICRVDAACVRAVPQHRVGRCREAFGKFRKEEKQRWRACGVPASVKGKPLRPLGSPARKKSNAGGLAEAPQAGKERI